MHLESPLDSLIRTLRTKPIAKLIPNKSTLCDIGCGKNPVLLKAVENRIVKAVGLDRANTNCSWKNVEIRNADFNNLPLPIKDAEFDCITMLAVLEHLENPEDILKECFRALKSGGKLIITTPSPLAKPILEFMALLNIISQEAIQDHKHYFKKNELKLMLDRLNFKDIKLWNIALNNAATAYKA